MTETIGFAADCDQSVACFILQANSGESSAPQDGAEIKGHGEPGHTEVVALRFKNEDNLALKYNINLNVVDEKEGVNKATVNGFANGTNTASKIWANKNSMDAAHLSVTIDGKKVQ